MTVRELLDAMPKTVKVGALKYNILIVHNLRDDDGKECTGLCNYSKQEISVDPDQPSCEYVVDTFLHELCHAMWAERKLKTRAAEETVVEAFGTALVGLFQDNPLLIEWIKQGLNEA
jgi:hypothetical protein